MAALTPAEIDYAVLDSLVDGTHAQPHEVLGPHIADGVVTVRVLRPNATSVDLVVGGEHIPMAHIHRGCGRPQWRAMMRRTTGCPSPTTVTPCLRMTLTGSCRRSERSTNT